MCFTKWLQSYGTHKHILWIQEHNFMCKTNFSSIRNNLEFEIFDSWGFPVTAGLQLFREPCQPSRKSCWEARRRARHIDPPVASSCLFTNNKSMQHSAGGCHAWPPICSEHSHTHTHKHCIEYTHTHMHTHTGREADWTVDVADLWYKAIFEQCLTKRGFCGFS